MLWVSLLIICGSHRFDINTPSCGKDILNFFFCNGYIFTANIVRLLLFFFKYFRRGKKIAIFHTKQLSTAFCILKQYKLKLPVFFA